MTVCRDEVNQPGAIPRKWRRCDANSRRQSGRRDRCTRVARTWVNWRSKGLAIGFVFSVLLAAAVYMVARISHGDDFAAAPTPAGRIADAGHESDSPATCFIADRGGPVDRPRAGDPMCATLERVAGRVFPQSCESIRSLLLAQSQRLAERYADDPQQRRRHHADDRGDDGAADPVQPSASTMIHAKRRRRSHRSRIAMALGR